MTSKWIWPFELLEKLGEGGMGVVYRARYVGNNKIVAVKLLPEDVAQNPTLVARFDRELEILTQLRHPNIVHCFGGTTENKQRFYAMELVEGGTLADILKKQGRLSWDYVIDYALQMCEALQYAHERGVIHRDLKPANFLLTKSRQIKLVDFGLATIVAGQKLTVAGRTAGTFLYMAPEQIRGQTLSPRTDLYALGCVLFELLTGKPPFGGETPAEVLHKHLKEPPPSVAAKMFDCPAALDRLVAQLLQKSPEQRPASAAEVKQRLEAVLRPSLARVDPLAQTPADHPVTPAVMTPGDDSVADVAVPRPGVRTAGRWPTVVVLVALVAVWGWWSAWTASARAKELQAMWSAAALEPGPGQLPALATLAHDEGLPADIVQKLMDQVATSTNVDFRLAALVVIEQHPQHAVPFRARLLGLQKDEQDQRVREQMAKTLATLRDYDAQPRRSALWKWLLGLAVLGLGGWWAWVELPWRRWIPR
jgi:predicted Ser/Thr protein kinase